MLKPKSWETLLILSIVVPVSILATSRLTGISRGPLDVSQTVTLNATTWSIERLYDGDLHFNDTIEASSNGEINLAQDVLIGEFRYDALYDSDDVILRINYSGTVRTGFISMVNVTFLEDYENSTVWITNIEGPIYFRSLSQNMSMDNYGHILVGKGLKAFVEFKGIDQPKGVSLSGMFAEWVLNSPASTVHLMTINIETIYYNGSVYKKIIQPFQLRMAPDNNDSFETAQEIQKGISQRFFIGGPDTEDYYKIYLTQNQSVHVNIGFLGASVPDLYVYIYDPRRNVIFYTDAATPIIFPKDISFTTNSTGFWFIQAQHGTNRGFYSLEVD